MSYAFSNRKKIRGWPQLIRQLEDLEARNIRLDPVDLANRGWTAHKLWISPFSDLIKRNPPGWFFRRYVESMLRVMDQWEKELQARGGDYYLALWLFEPSQATSQVVAAVDHRIDFYRHRFRNKTAPAKFPQCVAPLQQKLVWQSKWHLNDYWIDEDDSPANIARLRALAIDEENHGDQTALLIPEGDMWIHERSNIQDPESQTGKARRSCLPV